MGQTQVKLYNFTLDQFFEKDVDTNDVICMFDFEKDEQDTMFITRKRAIENLLPDRWALCHTIYATANCGDPYIFIPGKLMFVVADETYEGFQQMKEKLYTFISQRN